MKLETILLMESLEHTGVLPYAGDTHTKVSLSFKKRPNGIRTVPYAKRMIMSSYMFMKMYKRRRK